MKIREAFNLIKENPEWLITAENIVPRDFLSVIERAIKIEDVLNRQNWQFEDLKLLFTLLLSAILEDEFDRESLVKATSSGFDLYLAEIKEIYDNALDMGLEEIIAKH